MGFPILIAHRGDRINFPENTLDAFDSAFDKGASGVELDIQLINEDIRVVHDYLIDSSKNYPLLQDVLKRFAQKGRLEIEIKSFSTNILKSLKELIDQYRSVDIEITSSELPVVPYISRLFPNTNIGVNFDSCHYKEWMDEKTYLAKIVNSMMLLEATVAHISNLPEVKLTDTLIKNLHSNGYKTHYHIGKQGIEKQLQLFDYLSAVGVDQCTFDDINLLEALKNRD